MVEFKSQRLLGKHPADDIWRAINTPLTGELAALVNPYVAIEYRDLSEQGMVQRGTLITYTPDVDKLRPVMGMNVVVLPEDVALRVEEHDPRKRLRIDVLESDKHSGMIRQQVEDVGNGTGLLIIEGEICLGGTRKMLESTIAPYAEQGIREHNKRYLKNLPAIIGQ